MGSTKPAGVITYICSSGPASSPESCLSDGSSSRSPSTSPPLLLAQSRKSDSLRAGPLGPPKHAHSRTSGPDRSSTTAAKSSITKLNGMVLLCKVCGDVASGFHYGVHACEGCKGFFRRSIQQNIQYKKCMKTENCTIVRINRNRCQQCRFKKCLSVGMSRDAVRFGRIPKREKQRMLLEMQNTMNNMMNSGQLHHMLRDSGISSSSSSSTSSSLSSPPSTSPPSSPSPPSLPCLQDAESAVLMDTSMSSASSCSSDSGEEDAVAVSGGERLSEAKGGKLWDRSGGVGPSDSHKASAESVQQTCPGYRITQQCHRPQPDNIAYCHYGSRNINEIAGRGGNRGHLVCPMNMSPVVDPSRPSHEIWEEFSQSFTPAVKEVVEFARQIPGFRELPQHDQVSLLKAGTFEVLMVRFASLFNVEERTVRFMSGRKYSVETLRSLGAGELLASMFDFSEKLTALRLSPEETSLFTAVVLVSADRTGVEAVSVVDALQEQLLRALKNLISEHRPDAAAVFTKLLLKLPELRSLNNLHSEELMAFKVHP